MPEPETFYNPISNETLRHRERSDGTRDLFIWQGNTTERSVDHQHNIIGSMGDVQKIRDFGGRHVCDDRT